MASDWLAPRTREHTFSTGRTATLREQMPTTELIRQGLFSEDELEALQALVDGQLGDPAKAAALSDAICIGMFVDPKLTLADKPAKGEVPIGVLDEVEIMETIDLAFESSAGVAGFRREQRRTQGRGSSTDVGDTPKSAARSRARKPGSARPRRKGG